ncbi:hypothetical protein [Edaphobacter bradus]|uniref:hypothetical protein n=1 Tax=Edaphobacter bradus TaxID=2259016 RepID=UPI0021E0348D|nr:hypothetical protein [Edaphobacter bradus]
MNQATLPPTGDSFESAILANALLIVSCVFLDGIWSVRVVFDAIWQSWYLFAIVSFARKMASERIHASRSVTAHQIVSSICVIDLKSQMNCSVWSNSQASARKSVVIRVYTS